VNYWPSVYEILLHEDGLINCQNNVNIILPAEGTVSWSYTITCVSTPCFNADLHIHSKKCKCKVRFIWIR